MKTGPTAFALSTVYMTLSAQAQIIPGPEEIHVNTYTPYSQYGAQVQFVPDNGFVVAWTSAGFGMGTQDGSDAGVFARGFDAQGNPRTSELLVNTLTQGLQTLGDLAIDGSGSITVVWESLGPDGDGWDVFGRRADPVGPPVSREFEINTSTVGHQRHPRLATTPDGRFVVAWESYRSSRPVATDWKILARRYDANGAPIGNEFQVNTQTLPGPQRPAVAIDPWGTFVIVWETCSYFGLDTHFCDVLARRFDSAGVAQGPEFRVNNSTPESQTNPVIAIDDLGDFVVAWQEQTGGQLPRGIRAQRFNFSGFPQEPDFRVDSEAENATAPLVAVSGTGSFIITYNPSNIYGFGVYGRVFDDFGGARGGEVRLSGEPIGFGPANSGLELKHNTGIAAYSSYLADSSAEVFVRPFGAELPSTPLNFQISVTPSELQVGEPQTLRIDLSNGGYQNRFDVYLILQEPDGQLASLVYQESGSFALQPGIQPVATAVSLPAGLIISQWIARDNLVYEQAGQHAWYAGLTRPGTFEIARLSVTPFVVD